MKVLVLLRLCCCRRWADVVVAYCRHVVSILGEVRAAMSTRPLHTRQQRRRDNWVECEEVLEVVETAAKDREGALFRLACGMHRVVPATTDLDLQPVELSFATHHLYKLGKVQLMQLSIARYYHGRPCLLSLRTVRMLHKRCSEQSSTLNFLPYQVHC